MIKHNEITGLILSGGRGRRAGRCDKGLLIFEGKMMIERQLHWFQNQVDDIIISANRNIEVYQKYRYPVVSDKNRRFNGPLEGISAALELCNTEWLFVQPIDLPFLPENTIEKLVQKVDGNNGLYYLTSDEREHYLSMLLNKNLSNALYQFIESGQRRVRDFLNQNNAITIDLSIEEKYFANFNQINDYQ